MAGVNLFLMIVSIAEDDRKIFNSKRLKVQFSQSADLLKIGEKENRKTDKCELIKCESKVWRRFKKLSLLTSKENSSGK